MSVQASYRRRRAQHLWVSWRGADVLAGLYGVALTGVLIMWQWGPLLSGPVTWSGELAGALAFRLIPVGAIGTLLALLGLELGIPLWAPWRLLRARRTLRIVADPPELVHTTGFGPLSVTRRYALADIAKVSLEIAHAEQHLKDERFAEFGRLALFRKGHRLPKILLHPTRTVDELIPLHDEIVRVLEAKPSADPDSRPGGRMVSVPGTPRRMRWDEV